MVGGAEGYNRRPPHQKALPEGLTRRPLSTRRPPYQRAITEGHFQSEGHNRRPLSIRRPQNQKAITEGHNRIPKGEIEGESGPGPHPRGKLRGIMSSPTPKGEIEGDQIQAHTQGGNWGRSDPGPHPRGKLRGIRSRPTPKGEIGESDPGPPPMRSRLWHTVNVRSVRILLECILVHTEASLCTVSFTVSVSGTFDLFWGTLWWTQ